MKNILIAFAALLALLTLITALGGSINSERFEEESTPLEQQIATNFWGQQQAALTEQFEEEQNDMEYDGNDMEYDGNDMEEEQNDMEDNQNEMMNEETQQDIPIAEHVQENYASCGSYYKEDFEDANVVEDVEPFEDEKTYGAF